MHNMYLVNDSSNEIENFKSDKVLIQKVFSGNPDFLINVHEFRRKYYDDLKKMDRIWYTVMRGLMYLSMERNDTSKLSVKDIVCQFIDNNCSGDTYGCKKLLYAWIMVYTRHRIFIFGENNDNRWMRTVRSLYQWFTPEGAFVKGFVWSKSERQIVTTLLEEINSSGKTNISNITTEEISAMTKLLQDVEDPKPETKEPEAERGPKTFLTSEMLNLKMEDFKNEELIQRVIFNGENVDVSSLRDYLTIPGLFGFVIYQLLREIKNYGNRKSLPQQVNQKKNLHSIIEDFLKKNVEEVASSDSYLRYMYVLVICYIRELLDKSYWGVTSCYDLKDIENFIGWFSVDGLNHQPFELDEEDLHVLNIIIQKVVDISEKKKGDDSVKKCKCFKGNPGPKCKVTLYSCPPCDGGVYMLNVTRKIDMAHQLDSAYSDACLNIHGHSYKVTFTFACLSLNRDGMAADFKLVKEKVDDIIVCPHDHALVISGKNPKLEEYMIQDLKMVIYDGDNPTAENMARIFYHTLKDELEIPGVTISVVEVEETEGNSAMYFVPENNTWE